MIIYFFVSLKSQIWINIQETKNQGNPEVHYQVSTLYR